MSDWFYSFPVALEMYTLLLAHLNSALNPILYWKFNPSFRKGYISVLRCITKNENLCLKTSKIISKYTVDKKSHEFVSNKTAEEIEEKY